MLIPIVDEHDVQIAIRDRTQLDPQDIGRVSALWLLDASGAVLLAQRALSKKINPGCWGCSVAGTVEVGETYESNLLKEAKEELGLSLVATDLTLGPKLLLNDGHKHFCQYYVARATQTDFAFDAREVSAVRWVSVPDLLADMTANPSTYSLVPEECLFLLSSVPPVHKR